MNSVHTYMCRFMLWLVCLLPCVAHASAALFMEEPFGTFGYVNPTGHAAIYLSDVCAESPTQLRPCEPGEGGVVISRYHHVDGYDWLAIPLIPYLYSVDSLAEIPQSVTPEQESLLRDRYRRSHLEALVPDGPGGTMPGGEWIQLIGASYDRKIYAFEVDTTPERDAEFIQAYNARRNVGHFNLFFNNCADFSRGALDFYYPHATHRSMIADAGMTTPKQLARSLAQYASRHERINFRTYEIPQISGSIPRSKPIDGVVESFLKKKYVVPVAILHPGIAVGLAAAYFWRGRYQPGQNAELLAAGPDLARLYQDNPAPNGAMLDPALGFPESTTQADVSSFMLIEENAAPRPAPDHSAQIR